LTYTLRHRSEVDGYLTERRQQAEAIRQEIQASPANQRLRQRLLTRRQG
jgi:hypothetical protein